MAQPVTTLNSSKKPKGGARPGAGRKPGGKNASTISKEQARDALRAIILQEMHAMTRSQVHAAIGINHFMLRDKATGQWKRLTNWREIEAALNDPDAIDGSTYWIYTKDPSTQAYTDLMNRALDKPKEQEVELHVSGDEALIAALQHGRKYWEKKGEDV